MDNSPSPIKIESREHLLSALAEASELNQILQWRKTMKEVAIQEMTHLALVSNLTSAIGGMAHFFRPAFPVHSGCFPADFVIELAPFDLDILEHFIFLERPAEKKIPHNDQFLPESEYSRASPPGRLMAHLGDYQTVGQLYEDIEEGIEFLSKKMGDTKPFC